MGTNKPKNKDLDPIPNKIIETVKSKLDLTAKTKKFKENESQRTSRINSKNNSRVPSTKNSKINSKNNTNFPSRVPSKENLHDEIIIVLEPKEEENYPIPNNSMEVKESKQVIQPFLEPEIPETESINNMVIDTPHGLFRGNVNDTINKSDVSNPSDSPSRNRLRDSQSFLRLEKVLDSVALSTLLKDFEITGKQNHFKKMTMAECFGQGRELIFASDQVSDSSKKSMEMCSK